MHRSPVRFSVALGLGLLLWLMTPIPSVWAADETPDTSKPPPRLVYLVNIIYTTPAGAVATGASTDAQATITYPATSKPPPRLVHLSNVVYSERPPVAFFCPISSNRTYDAIPIQGNPRSSPYTPAQDPDLNLAVRGYGPSPAPLGLINLGGDTDDDAPQLAFLFRPSRVPRFAAAHRVNDWNWGCVGAVPGGGCLGGPLTQWDATLVSMATTPEEAIHLPTRRADILNGVYSAMVLYADATRLTLTYTRQDTPAPGYVLHIEDFCVDPNLLALYRQLDMAGRRTLPGLRRDAVLGVAQNSVVRVAVRDTGEFMDPRSAKDWWQAVVRALQTERGLQ